MSLLPICNQPINFCQSPVQVDCPDEAPPLLISTGDTLLLQVGVGCCDTDPQIAQPTFASGWVKSGRWSVAPGSASSTDGNNFASIEWPSFNPTVFERYCVAIDFGIVTGQGVEVRIGGVVYDVGDAGLFSATFTAQTTDVLNIRLKGPGAQVEILSAQVFPAASNVGIALFGCDDSPYPLFTANEEDDPQYFTFVGGILKVAVPMEDTGIEDGCFSVTMVAECGEDSISLQSETALKVDSEECRRTIKVRVCNDTDKMGFAAGYFEMRVPGSISRPRWPVSAEDYRRSDGRWVRSNADRETRLTLDVEPVGYDHHQFLSTLALWDHVYIGAGNEYMVTAGEYAPIYEARTSMGPVALEVRPKGELLRNVKCTVEGEGCDPAGDPQCNTPQVNVSPRLQDNEWYVDVQIFGELGFVPDQLQYTVNGVLQTPITIAAPQEIALGPLRPRALVEISITNKLDGECKWSAEPIRIPDPLSQRFTINVVGDAGVASFNIATDSGFYTVANSSGYSEVVASGDQPTALASFAGQYLMYSSDANGIPSGQIEDVQIFDLPFIPLDFSQLTDVQVVLCDTCSLTIPIILPASSTLTEYQINNQGTAVLSLLPDLSLFPALTTLSLAENGLTSAPDISGNPQLISIELGSNALTATAVDTLFIQADALNLNNMFISTAGGANAAPTAASAAARAAIISRGGSIFTN